MPVACSSRRAVTAATAAPVTGRPCPAQTWAAAARAAVLPAPAGPTTTASPSAAASRFDHLPLLAGQGPSRHRSRQLVRRHLAGRHRGQVAGEAQGGLLDPEQLGGGPPRPVLRRGDEPDDVAAGQHPIRERLQCGPVGDRAGRQGLADGLQQVAPVEPGGLRGQPGRVRADSW